MGQCTLKMAETNAATFKCEPCGYETNRSSNLQTHVESTRHKLKVTNSPRHLCLDCQYTTNNSSHMKRHRKTHMEVEAAPTVSTDALENRVLIMERLIASMVTRIDNLENAMP